MLDRYKKNGGFIQILKLIENCDPVKQERLLKVIQEEDPFWEQLIQKKRLTLERIASWAEDSMTQALENLPPLTLATVLHQLEESKRAVFFNSLAFSKKRNLEDLYGELTPSPGESSAAVTKLIVHVRGLIEDGKLKLETICPDLVIAPDIDLMLMGSKPQLDGITITQPTPLKTVPEVKTSRADTPAEDRGKLEKLSAKIVELSEDNQRLRNENAQLRSKLAQIKRIA